MIFLTPVRFSLTGNHFFLYPVTDSGERVVAVSISDVKRRPDNRIVRNGLGK